ncbi:MAG: HET domain-containing protein [Candidatus Moeniiplasma glomeromycotorum]|nr:HET domain-containing protein [Candidatus Moeniiplasma glomeromycotorum]MCE8169534.1 HET domain-containing protein [Candidatus Moeniiplasma glomeromycotorum]
MRKQETNESKLKKINAQEYFDQNYPKEKRAEIIELDISFCNLEGHCNLQDFVNLKKLDCSFNNLSSLDISNCSKLTELKCRKNNPLNNLDVTKNINLVSLECVGCSLSKLDLSQNPKINNLVGDYLEISLGNIEEEIFVGDIRGFEVENPRQEIRISPQTPKWWYDIFQEDKKDYMTIEMKYTQESIKENYDTKEMQWGEIYPKSSFEWKRNKESLSLEKLPTKLYNIKTGQIEYTKEGSDIKNYAILSYVWGEVGNLSTEANSELNNIWNNVDYKNKLNPSGYKSWKKAIKTCEKLGINHLWVDQLCINQSDERDENGKTDKEKEVPKMRQYYNNATATLIAINMKAASKTRPIPLEIIELVVNSQWFTRSWTFQEGWLSKQTIFMFDDTLVDGRFLASVWVLKQSTDTEGGRYWNLGEFNEALQKNATPLGWTYYQKDYDDSDILSLTLGHTLQTIAERKRTLPIDGIYSILGLLPYGEQVNVEYKEWGQWYTEEELKEKLVEVMKLAAKNGYAEPLAWHGIGNSWLPEIDKFGSTSVIEAINLTCESTSIIFEENNDIRVSGSKYIIESMDNFHLNFDFYSYKNLFPFEWTVKVKFLNEQEESINETINLGFWNREVGKDGDLDKVRVGEEKDGEIKVNDILFIPNGEEWKGDKNCGLLLRKKNDCYYRKGLVKVSKGFEKLEKSKKEKITISINQELQTQIEVPPKGNN